jgi:hypothetical protein
MDHAVEAVGASVAEVQVGVFQRVPGDVVLHRGDPADRPVLPPRRLAAFLTPETADNWRFVCEGAIADDPRLSVEVTRKAGARVTLPANVGDHVPGPSQSDRGRTDVDRAAARVDACCPGRSSRRRCGCACHARTPSDMRTARCSQGRGVGSSRGSPAARGVNERGGTLSRDCAGHSADHGLRRRYSSDPRSTVASWSW